MQALLFPEFRETPASKQLPNQIIADSNAIISMRYIRAHTLVYTVVYELARAVKRTVYTFPSGHARQASDLPKAWLSKSLLRARDPSLSCSEQKSHTTKVVSASQTDIRLCQIAAFFPFN